MSEPLLEAARRAVPFLQQCFKAEATTLGALEVHSVLEGLKTAIDQAEASDDGETPRKGEVSDYSFPDTELRHLRGRITELEAQRAAWDTERTKLVWCTMSRKVTRDLAGQLNTLKARYSDPAARIAELEAKQERLIGWLVEASQIPCTELWTFEGWRVSAGACEAAIRKALETLNSGDRREGEK
jgi:hypothetical protein